jgi:hypothetical protein
MVAAGMRVAGAAFTLALAAACGGNSSTTTLTSANVAGSYTVDVTNGNNGCNIAGWTDNAMSMNIGVTVAQNGTQLTVTVGGGGLVGALLTAVLGTDTFSGPLVGESSTLTATGTVQGTQGSCTFTTNATIQASFNGDTMQGTVTYERVPVGASSGCTALQGCMSIQNFSGVRPPGSH